MNLAFITEVIYIIILILPASLNLKIDKFYKITDQDRKKPDEDEVLVLKKIRIQSTHEKVL